MLYISFALILFGILLFIYSVFSDSRLTEKRENDLSETNFSESPLRSVANKDLHNMENNYSKQSFDIHENDYTPDLKQRHSSRDEMKKDNSENYPDIAFDDDDDNYKHEDLSGELYHEDNQMDDFVDEGQDKDNQEKSNIDTEGIIFFDDRSSVIDYFNESGRIDSSLEQYGNIKRIGEGKLVLERDGINFYMERKIFRFDFHRINDLFTGENYLAIQLKGNEAIKLFVVKDWTETLKLIKEKFKEYKESTTL